MSRPLRVLVADSSLNSCDGVEKVALHTIRALVGAGHEVTISTVEKTRWEKVSRMMPVKIGGSVRERYLLEQLKFQRLSLYQELLWSELLTRGTEFDVKINMLGDAMLGPAHITYVHFPTLLLLLRGKFVPHTKFGSSLIWKMYPAPYKAVKAVHFALRRILERTKFVTNSVFSRRVLMMCVKKRPMVIHPPVELEQYSEFLSNLNREESVVSIGRFSPEKNWHMLPHIAAKMPTVTFFLMGSVVDQASRRYYEEILALRDSIAAKNLTVIPDASHELKLNFLGRSKVLLHLRPNEHFGLVVAEAMAAGVVPVVHKSGGPWLDITEEGTYGVGYAQLDIDQIVRVLRRAIASWMPAEAKRVSGRSSRFSADLFAERILEVVAAHGRRGG